MQVNVQATMDIDDHELDQAIIQDAARQILGSVHVRHEQATQAVNAVLTKRAEEFVERLFAQGFQQTDSMGRPVGEKRTMEDVFAEACKNYLSVRVDSYGNPSKESVGYSNHRTRGEHLLATIAEAKLATLAQAEVKRVSEMAKDRIKDTVATAIAASLAAMAKK